ncbi:MAG: hypothetical protein ACREPM_24085, partial [Gemmatimonadaceae bacterium]
MRALCCLVLTAVVIACGSSTEPTGDISLDPTSTDVAGGYNLIAANGTAPPFPAFETQTADWTLTSDSVVIAPPNAWIESTAYLVTSLLDGSTSTEYSVVSGSYVIANAAINFTMLQGGTATFTGSVTGNTLTLIYSGKRFVYT